MAEIKIGMELHEQLFVATTSVQINPNFDACWKYYFCAYQFYSCSLWFHFWSWFFINIPRELRENISKIATFGIEGGEEEEDSDSSESSNEDDI